MLRVADYIMERLYDEGIEYIYMVTGRGALFLSDAVARHKVLAGVSMHHEQAAAYAAVAHAQYTDKLGACLVSTGCAATNAITAVLSAWQDGIPCVFISGQNMLRETSRYTGIPLRTFGQQEADIVSIVESITKYATMITDPKKIRYEMEKALHLAQIGRKGPVWIDIPLDIQSMHVDIKTLDNFKISLEENIKLKTLSDDIQYVKTLLNQSQRPTILIGSGIRSANAIDELEHLLEKKPMPVVFTSSAPDTYGAVHNLSIGSVGIMGCTRSGNFTVQNADLLLVLGCRLSSMTTGTDYCKFAREAKIVVVDIDPVEHSKESIHIDRLITTDVKNFLIQLSAEEIDANYDIWTQKCQHWKEIYPIYENTYKADAKIDLYYLAQCLSDLLPKQSIFVSDSGLIELILPTNIRFSKGQRCIHPNSQGAMGFALPAAIGAYYASDGLPVIACIGDGSIMMNLQELETIRYRKLPIKVIIINNNVYAVIRKRQIELFRSRTIGTDPKDGISCPDFRKVANTFDLSYVKIEINAELEQKLNTVIKIDGPVLCEIMGLENQGYINVSHVRNAEGRFVRRPIEDQSPFLNRELFLSEMLISPIDL